MVQEITGEMGVQVAILLAIKHADEKHDGHFSLMKFTTNWRAGFLTPMDSYEVHDMSVANKPETAIRMALLNCSDNGCETVEK